MIFSGSGTGAESRDAGERHALLRGGGLLAERAQARGVEVAEELPDAAGAAERRQRHDLLAEENAGRAA